MKTKFLSTTDYRRLLCALIWVGSLGVFISPKNIYAQESDSLMAKRLEQFEYIVDCIEHKYISGKRGISDEEWQRRVELARSKVVAPNTTSYALRHMGTLIEDAHFAFPDGGLYNRFRRFSKEDSLLPLWVKTWIDGTVFVVNDYTGTIPKHAQILSVNSVNAQQAALTYRSQYAGEPLYAAANVNVWMEPDCRHWDNFSNYFFFEGIKPPYIVTYKVLGDTCTRKAILSPLSRGQITHLAKRTSDWERVKRMNGGSDKYMRYRRINDSTAVLEINLLWSKDYFGLLVLNRDNRFGRKLRRTMHRIEHQNIEHLVIDISKNGGGVSENMYKVFNYLTDKPIETSELIHVTDDSREQLKIVIENTGERYNGMTKKDYKLLAARFDSIPNGTMVATDTLYDAYFYPQPIKHKFRGHSYLVTGPLTYSAAQLFAQIYQDLDIGPVIGQPCGGYRAVTLGNVANLKLPLHYWIPFGVPIGVAKAYVENGFTYNTVDVYVEQTFEEWLRDENNWVGTALEIIKEGTCPE